MQSKIEIDDEIELLLNKLLEKEELALLTDIIKQKGALSKVR